MSGLMDNESNDIDLDESVDGTVAAPDFITPPSGLYLLAVKKVKTSTKEDKDKDGKLVKKSRANVTITVVETKDIGDEVPVPDGSMFGMNYQWTEQGKGFLKALAEKIVGAEAIKGASWKAIFAEMEGKKFEARIRIKKDGDYENVNLNDIKQVA